MKKFIAMLTLLIGFNANAGLLTIDLSTDEASVGESVLVTINASDFDETDYFSFDFNFDSSVMAYDGSSLSSDLTLADDDPMFNGLSAMIEDYGLFFEFAADDGSFAAGNFVLASFSLIADADGFTNFSLADFFNPSAFDDYTIAFSGASSVNVSASSIPEPSSMALLMLAGFAFANSRRKAK